MDLKTYQHIKQLGKRLLAGENPNELNWALVEEIIHLGRCEHALVFWSTNTQRELICQAHMNAQGKRGPVVGSTIALGIERDASRPSLNTWFRSGEVVNAIKLPRVIERMPLKTVLLSYGIEAKSSLLIPINTLYDDYFGFVLALNATTSEAAVGFDIHSEELITLLASIAGATLLERTRSKRQESLFIELSTQHSTSQLLEAIIDQAQAITQAEGGSLYIVKEPLNETPTLEFALVRNSKLGIRYGGTSDSLIPFEPIPLLTDNGVPNTENVASCAANSKQIVIIDDAYDADGFDFSQTKAFDEATGYRSQSFLAIPLKNHEDDVVAVLQLVNATDPHTGERIAFKAQHIPLIKTLATYAAIALNNRLLVRGLKQLLEAFVKTLANAINANSTYPANRYQRVPLLVELMATAACEDEALFSDFKLGADQWYELKLAAWLHDCGKLTPPETALKNATKQPLSRDSFRTLDEGYVQATIDMLEALPFPKKLQHIPEYAGAHHEKMDGTGIPRGLKRDQLSIPARMIAIAVIFEALTTQDHPDKEPKKLSDALSAMKNLRDANHIDADLYDLFIRKRVWYTYAEQVLLPEQLNLDEASDYL